MKKISLQNMKGALSRDEMKKISGGSGSNVRCDQYGDCCAVATCYYYRCCSGICRSFSSGYRQCVPV